LFFTVSISTVLIVIPSDSSCRDISRYFVITENIGNARPEKRIFLEFPLVCL